MILKKGLVRLKKTKKLELFLTRMRMIMQERLHRMRHKMKDKMCKTQQMRKIQNSNRVKIKLTRHLPIQKVQ